jgi:hypothetical protein
LINAGAIQQTGGNGNVAILVSGGAGHSGSANITNSGTIQASGTSAIETSAIQSVAGTTVITNNQGATIQGTTGQSIGVFSFSSISTMVSNAGTISGTEDGINTNTSGTTTIINSGTISGASRAGVRVGSASITNTTGGSVSRLTGIFFRAGNGASGITNDGTITGTGGTAIQFSTGSVGNTLTLGTNSVINGNVLGAGSDSLQLVGASGTGTLNVSQYQGFSTFTKSGGSTWLLTGTDPTQNWAASAGVIGGTATIGGLAVQTGVTFMPGNGTAGTSMTLTGNLSFAPSTTYLVNVSPATASSTSINGTASLTGSTVQTVFAAGSYMPHTYTILHAAGGLGGTMFSGLTGLPVGFTAQLDYTTTDVKLDVTAALGALGTNGLNGNQQNVANALNNFFNRGGTLPPGFLTLFGLTGPGLANALSQTSNEAATGSQQTTFNAMTQFVGVLTDPFIAGRGDPLTASSGASPYVDEDGGANAYAAKGNPRTAAERDAYAAIYRKAPPPADQFAQRWSVWAAGFGGAQATDGSTLLGSNNTTSRIAGTAVGADYRFSPFTLAGFALAGGGTSFNVTNGGTGRSDLFQVGAFIRHTVGPAYISGALAYGWQDVTTDRILTVSGIDHLRAEFNANAVSGRAEGGYRFVQPWIGGIGITPYAAAQFVTFDLPAYAEQAVSGASTFAQAFGARDVTDTRSEFPSASIGGIMGACRPARKRSPSRKCARQVCGVC